MNEHAVEVGKMEKWRGERAVERGGTRDLMVVTGVRKTAVNRVDRGTHHCWGLQGCAQPPNMLPRRLITLILSNMMSEMKKDKSSMVCAVPGSHVGICGLLPQAVLKPKVHEDVCELGCH